MTSAHWCKVTDHLFYVP